MMRVAVFGLALVAMASGAAATTSLNFTAASVGQQQQVAFDGFTDDFDKGTTALPGLSANLGLTLQGISGNTWTFAYSVANTSSAPVTTSRVSVFGFNVANLDSATAAGEFSSVGSGNVPVGRGRRDVCFRTGNGGQCAGGGNGGATIGEDPSTGTFNLVFASSTSNVVLNDLFVRYQSLNAPSLNVKGSSGVGDAYDAGSGIGLGVVPEPATWAMLITGFGLVGAGMRRQRTVAANA